MLVNANILLSTATAHPLYKQPSNTHAYLCFQIHSYISYIMPNIISTKQTASQTLALTPCHISKHTSRHHLCHSKIKSLSNVASPLNKLAYRLGAWFTPNIPSNLIGCVSFSPKNHSRVWRSRLIYPFDTENLVAEKEKKQQNSRLWMLWWSKVLRWVMRERPLTVLDCCLLTSGEQTTTMHIE